MQKNLQKTILLAFLVVGVFITQSGSSGTHPLTPLTNGYKQNRQERIKNTEYLEVQNRGTGLTAEYFKDINLIQPAFSRMDKQIDFNWGWQSPASSIPKDKFSVRWSGWIQPRFSEEYILSISSDDGCRLWINDEIVIDDWTDHYSETFQTKLKVRAGKKYKIKLEYYDFFGSARVRLQWESASQNRQVIPQAQLYPFSQRELNARTKARGLILRIGVAGSITDQELKRITNEIKKASGHLHAISMKELYLAEAIISIGSVKGDLVYDATYPYMPTGLKNIPMAPKYWNTAMIVHELSHSVLRLLDDDIGYGYEWGKGPHPCIMNHNWDQPYCTDCIKRLGLGRMYGHTPLSEVPAPPETAITVRHVDPGSMHEQEVTLEDTYVWLLENGFKLELQEIKEIRYIDFRLRPNIRRGIVDRELVYFKHLTNLEDLDISRNFIQGEGLKYLKDCTKLKKLNLNGTEVSGDALQYLKPLKNLEELILVGTNINNQSLAFLKDLPSLKRLSLNATNIGDAGLAHLASLTNLEELYLDSTKITDQGFRHLKNLKNLKSLGCEYTKLDGSGLVYIKNLVNLQKLEFNKTNIGDDNIKYLSGLTQLKSLELRYTLITDQGFKFLTNLDKLQRLELGHTNITDQACVYLKQLSDLRVLLLYETGITDQGLMHLKDAPKLAIINLSHTKVTDTGLLYLKDAKNLQELNLYGTKVTMQGFNKLKAYFPKLRQTGLK